MRRANRYAALLCGALATLCASPASAAVDHTAPMTDVRAELAGAPAQVRALASRIESHGATLLALHHAEYHLTGTAAAASPADFPTGCGLWVAIYHSGGYIESSSLTACTTPATEIQMLGGIARSRWFGPEEVATDEDGDFGSDSLTLDFSYDCGNTGTHDFYATTNGYVEIGGADAQASAYDEIDNQSC